MDSYNSPTTKPLFKGTQIVWYILSILEVVLIFRFLLKLAGANASAGFTRFIYNLSQPFTAPFNAVFQRSSIQDSVFEWTTILAMIVYWIVALGIINLFLMSKTVSTGEAAAKLEEKDS